MTARLDLARDLVTTWAPLLGLDTWDLEALVGRDMSGDLALCHASFSYDQAAIEIQPWLLGMGEPPAPDVSSGVRAATDDRRFEVIIVHELLHAFMRRHDRAHARIREQLPEAVRDAFNVLIADANEEIVDRLARTLVDLRHASLAPVTAGQVRFIARCPEHGLHGCRDTCFECGGPVEKVAMVPVVGIGQEQRNG